MIEMIVLVLLIGSIAAAPNIAKNMELSPLPNTENLDEKAMPLSKLFIDYQTPGGANLMEKSQVRADLPGTRNLAEKRIPELVLQKLSQPFKIGREDS